jgi:hypothetical protein
MSHTIVNTPSLELSRAFPFYVFCDEHNDKLYCSSKTKAREIIKNGFCRDCIRSASTSEVPTVKRTYRKKQPNPGVHGVFKTRNHRSNCPRYFIECECGFKIVGTGPLAKAQAEALFRDHEFKICENIA